MSDVAFELLKERRGELVSERSWTEMRILSLRADLERSEQRLEEQDQQIAKLEKAITQLGGRIE